jgi:hypothetical protein
MIVMAFCGSSISDLNAAGERRTAKLETANGYRLTTDGTKMSCNTAAALMLRG